MPFDLDALAARRARLVPDTGRATRPSVSQETPELDENGDVVPGQGRVVYEGPGMLSDPSQATQGSLTANDGSGVPHIRVLKVPHSCDLLPGDIWEVLSARWAPGLVGDTLIVLHEEERSLSLYRRYVVRGSSWKAPVL